jgi:hypothetical protein
VGSGMGAAMFTILWMRIKLEYRSVIFCSCGALVGLVFGKFIIQVLKREMDRLFETKSLPRIFFM